MAAGQSRLPARIRVGVVIVIWRQPFPAGATKKKVRPIKFIGACRGPWDKVFHQFIPRRYHTLAVSTEATLIFAQAFFDRLPPSWIGFEVIPGGRGRSTGKPRSVIRQLLRFGRGLADSLHD